VLKIVRSRRKARSAAVAEVVAVLEDLGGRPLPGGPRSEVAGVAWAAVDKEAPLVELSHRLDRLGYCEAVDLAVPRAELDEPDERWPMARWRGADVVLVPVQSHGTDELRAEAPDQRSFLLECDDGVVRRIQGYRGGRGPLEHRALPTSDARLLVNLVHQSDGGTLLDPFAGAGSVILQARSRGWRTLSSDVDRRLRFGLAELADYHVVADAASLPVQPGRVDAVATEPPYDNRALDCVQSSVGQAAAVLRPGGRIAMLIASTQVEQVRRSALETGLLVDLELPIDRRGLAVTCLRMRRPK
jgi:hypothetical protein